MNGFQTFIGVEDFKTVEILRNLFGEFLGTFLYVFVGVMSTVSLSKSLITSVIPVAFAFGLSLSTVSHVVQRASGAHLNPAISISSMNDPTRNDLNLSGPLVVGLSVASGHLVGYLLSSSSMNPARSFGPALVNLDFKYHWIYWIGPILGGVLGAIYYAFGMQDREALKRYYSRRNVSRKSSIRSIT
ncbi:unnamed protein product [Ceratitis capitata]|uniref:(Mediterranean fruit fly) hypothetical protein n=1 Tax=Ceratitis capitata TaxID=7213 RepID=A0A811UEL9_CERCA|nr:unnamed protein product [Ceratitis capitata]